MISVKVDLRPAQRALGDFGKQVPFATALALTSLAQGVQEAEDAEAAKVLDKETSFTKRAFGKTPATKKRFVATVFIKDTTSAAGGQNAYLAPYVIGGDRSLGTKKAMLAPVGAATNQYGNLSKGQLARLKAKPGVFIGAVQTKRGPVSGVWQRVAQPKRKAGGGKARLKLLIEFEDTTAVRKRLDFYGRAQAYVQRNAVPVFNDALARAIATKRK